MDNNLYNIETDNEDIYFIPKEGYDSALIWLPGYADTAKSYIEDIPDERRPVPEKMKVIILTAPKVGGTYSWDTSMTCTNTERISKVINSEAKVVGGYSRVFLGGFSQGAMMTFLLGLTLKNIVLGGLICCAGSYYSFIRPESDRKTLPIIICQGTQDNIISHKSAMQSYKHLFDEGYNVIYKTYDIKHELIWAEYKDIKEFIVNILNN